MNVQGTFHHGGRLAASLQPGALALAFDQQTVLTYDRAGRLWSALLDGVTYRRGYDGRIMAKRTTRGRRARRWLDGPAADAVLARAAALMRSLHAARGAWEAPPDIQAQLADIVGRAARFTPQAAAADARRFHSIYKPIGILPPDQYLALVLQLTEGCPFNTCTFCTLYRDRPFRIKPLDEFRAHVAAVLDYVGPALPMRKSLFLADANALGVPQDRLVESLVALPAALAAGRARAGGMAVYAFVDGFSGARKAPRDYAELAAHGLKRVYLGLESGHDALLKFLNKPGTAAQAVTAAQAMQAGGLAVCVIILLGAGGTRFADGHIGDTIQAVNAMALGAGDMIYFSEFVEQPGQPYGAIAARERLAPLTPRQMLEQRRAIQAGLRFDGQPPRISTYDIREFVY